MNKYFYQDGYREYGPFTAQELSTKDIRPHYLLRLEGRDQLKQAKEVEEVASLFKGRQPHWAPSKPEHVTSTQSKQQLFERDFSFEEQQTAGYQRTTGLKADRRQHLLIGVLAFWFFDIFLKWVLNMLQVDIWQGPAEIIIVVMGLIFSFTPILIALSIRNKNYRAIAMVLASLITLRMVISNIMWAFYGTIY